MSERRDAAARNRMSLRKTGLIRASSAFAVARPGVPIRLLRFFFGHTVSHCVVTRRAGASTKWQSRHQVVFAF